MKKTDKKNADSKAKLTSGAKKVLENDSVFALGEFKVDSLSSAETIGKENVAGGENLPKSFLADSRTEGVSGDVSTDLSKLENPIFRELAEPKLPPLAKENRARLQMQSPTRLHFYWFVKGDSFEILHRIFGNNAAQYTLVVRLVNQTSGATEISPIETAGSWWFDVDSDAAYRAEIGFYSDARVFVSLMVSNSVQTPRRSPSARPASDSNWAISADAFAQVLDNSGFTHDAFEVALAGDDRDAAEIATRAAFANYFGDADNDFAAADSSEMRFALFALASGYSLENLRPQISSSLYSELQKKSENLTAEKALAALRENFGVFGDESTEEEPLAPTVFGASSVNFARPSKRFFKQNALPKFAPVSSF